MSCIALFWKPLPNSDQMKLKEPKCTTQQRDYRLVVVVRSVGCWGMMTNDGQRVKTQVSLVGNFPSWWPTFYDKLADDEGSRKTINNQFNGHSHNFKQTRIAAENYANVLTFLSIERSIQ